MKSASIKEVQRKEDHKFGKEILELNVSLLEKSATSDVLGNVVYAIGNILTMGELYISEAKKLGVIEKINGKLSTLSEEEKGPVFF